MKTFKLICFEITTPDGGGMYNEHVAFVATKEMAEVICKQKPGDWPMNYSEKSFNIKVFENLTEMKSEKLKEKKEAALAKLSDEEKKLLGLDNVIIGQDHSR